MPLSVTIVVVPCAALTFVAGAAAPGAGDDRPELRHFKSGSVGITNSSPSTVTNILPPPEQRTASDVQARIGLTFSNKTRRALWMVVRLTPPPPNPPCAQGVAYLEPKAEVEFRCTQEALVADADYPLDIIVFADSALTDTLEQNRTRLRFDRGTVRWLEERLAFRRQELEADKLPKTDEHIRMGERRGFGVVIGFSGGVAVPTGDLADGFGTGGMGTTFFGVTGRRFGARLLFGSTEPRVLGTTNDAYSMRLGRPVEVMQAIVPVELQGVAAFPAQTSRLAVAFQAGAGLHVATVRLKDTDNHLDDENRFGASAGAGLRYGVTPPGGSFTVSTGLNGVFHWSGASRYLTVELELALAL